MQNKPRSNVNPMFRLRSAEKIVTDLRSMRAIAAKAGLTQTLKRIRAALSSATGAVRNAQCKVTRHTP